MKDCMAAADLVICRCGAMTLTELQACGKPSILIPSPYVTENHQFHNAQALVKRGAALCIEEKDLTATDLSAKELTDDGKAESLSVTRMTTLPYTKACSPKHKRSLC